MLPYAVGFLTRMVCSLEKSCGSDSAENEEIESAQTTHNLEFYKAFFRIIMCVAY
jgi:hypothetical protein